MITWRLSKGGELLGEYGAESEAIEAREALCGLNQRDDYLIASFSQIDPFFTSKVKTKDHGRQCSIKIFGQWT